MGTEAAKQTEGIRKWHSLFVVVSCWVIMALHIGFVYSIGALFTDVMSTFNRSRAETAAIQSTSLAVMGCSGIFSGTLINKFGLVIVGIIGSLVASLGLMSCFFASSLTYLIISVGVVSGFGASCLYVVSAAVISTHFSGRKPFLYLAILNTGSGMGNMIYPYLIRSLSDMYGFRGALLIIGAIGMNTVPGCILWKRKSNSTKQSKQTVFDRQITEFQTRFQVKAEDNGENIILEKLKHNRSTDVLDFAYVNQYPVLQGKAQTRTVIVQSSGNKSVSSYKNEAGQTLYGKIRQILNNKSVMFFAIGTVFLSPCLNLVFIFVADIYQDNGMTRADVSLGMFLLGIMNTVARFIPGILLQFKGISTLALPLMNAVVSVVLLVSFNFVQSRWLIIILTSAIGIPRGASLTMATAVTLKLVGSNKLPVAVGMLLTLSGIVQAIAGPVNGYIRDVAGSYTTLFYIAAGITFVAATIFFVAYIARRRNKQHLRRHTSVFYLTSF